MTRERRRVAITGLGLVTPLGNDVAATWDALLAGRSGVGAITSFDASGFPVRIAAEVKAFDPGRVIEDRKLLKFANRYSRLRARRGRGSAARRRDPAEREHCDALGLCRRQRHDGRRVSRARGGASPRCARRPTQHAASVRRRRSRRIPIAFCRSQTSAGLGRVAAPLRHSRLRQHRAHRLRLGRPGRRVGDEADPARHRRVRARRRLRFDDQPDRSGRLLLARCAVSRQRHAATRQPSLRRHPQRLRARRRRRLPGARGVDRGAPARGAHLRGAGRRRQLAEQLPHHRLASVRRRPDPSDAPGTRRRRRGAGETSTTSTPTAPRR